MGRFHGRRPPSGERPTFGYVAPPDAFRAPALSSEMLAASSVSARRASRALARSDETLSSPGTFVVVGTTFRTVFGQRVLIRLGLATLKRSPAAGDDAPDGEDEENGNGGAP
jgi:hypothetical protein